MKTILVPIDFSPVSEKQAEYAAFIAKKLNASVLLCYVISEATYIGITGTGDVLNPGPLLNLDMIRQADQFWIERMSKFQKSLGYRFPDIKWESKSLKGEPAYELLNYIETYTPLLVVMGMNSAKEGISARGNVIVNIVKKSVVPVWVYIAGDRNIHDMKRVAYTTDFMHPDKQILTELLAFLKPFGVKLYCIHICLDGNYLRAFSRTNDLKLYFKKDYLEERIVFDVLEERKAGIAIQKFIQENEIDLISYVPTSKSIFDKMFRNRLSRKHLIDTKLPILVWKESEV